MLFAVLKDMKSFKISNHFILIGIILGFLINVSEAGRTGLVTCFCGVLTPVILLFLLFLIKVLGAGDIKLFSVAGAFYGTSFVLKTILIAFLFGAVMSVIHLIRHRLVFCRLRHFIRYIQVIYKKYTVPQQGAGRFEILPYYDLARDGYQGVIHFSIAIFLAVSAQIFLGV